MTFSTVQNIILIKLVHAVIWFGVVDRESPEHSEAFRKLKQAEEAELDSLPKEKRDSAYRIALRNADAILSPYVQQSTEASKFGLALVYVIQELTNQGLFEPNEAFADVLENGLMHEQGSIVEQHQVALVSASAVKLGRRLMKSMQSLGYFREVRAA
jgi:hypothetical protein